jgi:alpha-galactosidase
VRSDDGDGALHVHGVVSADRSQALLAVVQTTTSVRAVPGRIRLPGLREDAVYEVRRLGPEPEWASMTSGWAGEVDPRLTVSGAVLTHSGVVVPGLHPESALVLGLVVRP